MRFAVVGDDGEPLDGPRPDAVTRVTSEPRPADPRRAPTAARRFLPKYTFDSFVIGSSNRFSHAAALAVAEAPGQAYNPLLIHGGTGLGKTHLLQAIGQYVRAQHPDLVPRYVTSETSRTSSSRRCATSGWTQFKQRYRARYDVLLVDDVQFLGGKERIQEEFFHTFNTLYEAGKQVVLTCDRPVREMGGLEQRLRSRFEWGLTTDVQPPDLETRLAILSQARRREPCADRRRRGARRDRAARRRQHPRARGRAHARDRLRLADRPADHAELVRETPARPLGRPARRHGRRTSRRSSARRSASRSRTSAPPAAPSSTCGRARSRCTSRASSPTSRCPRIGDGFCRDHTTVLYAVRRVAERIREDRLEYNLVQDLITAHPPAAVGGARDARSRSCRKQELRDRTGRDTEQRKRTIGGTRQDEIPRTCRGPADEIQPGTQLASSKPKRVSGDVPPDVFRPHLCGMTSGQAT